MDGTQNHCGYFVSMLEFGTTKLFIQCWQSVARGKGKTGWKSCIRETPNHSTDVDSSTNNKNLFLIYIFLIGGLQSMLAPRPTHYWCSRPFLFRGWSTNTPLLQLDIFLLNSQFIFNWSCYQYLLHSFDPF